MRGKRAKYLRRFTADITGMVDKRDERVYTRDRGNAIVLEVGHRWFYQRLKRNLRKELL
jgi:hypothetical protein